MYPAVSCYHEKIEKFDLHNKMLKTKFYIMFDTKTKFQP